MEHSPGNEIYEATIRCDQTFEFSISEIQDGKYVLREFQQRFWAWATNAGALAEPCLSLDARLLNHEKPRHMLLALLDLIQDNLQAALEFDTSLSSEGTCKPPITEEVPYFTHSINIDTRTPDVEHLKYPFQGLEAAIQRLNLISSLIDHSSRKGRQRRLEALHEHAVTDSTLTFITDASRFEFLAQAIIGHLWGGVSGQVVMKLARSVLFRKQRIAYTRYRKQARQIPRLQGPQAHTEGSHLLTTPSVVGDGARLHLESNFDSKLPRQAEQVPSEWLRPSTVDGESFARGQLGSSGPSSESRKTHSVWTKNIAYPKAPKANAVSDSEIGLAPCPFCQNMFPYQLYEDSDWWRKHVDHDLEPYVCVSDECSQPPMTFSNHSEWLQHMNIAHGPHWVVDLQDISYRGASEVVREGQGTPSCPMCLYDPSNTERTPIVRFKEPEETLGSQSGNSNLSHPTRHLLKATDTNLSRHIAEHLKMLCFRMLSIDTNLSQETDDALESGTSSKGMKFSQTTTQTTSPSGMDSEMGNISLNFEDANDLLPSEVTANNVEQSNAQVPDSGYQVNDIHETTGRDVFGAHEGSSFTPSEAWNVKPVPENRVASDTLFTEITSKMRFTSNIGSKSLSQSLSQILGKSREQDALNQARKFVPRHVLDAVVTRESVRAALKKSNAGRKFWDLSTKTVIDIVFSKNLKKTFVILSYLDVPWDVKKFYEAGLTDADLPLTTVRPEGESLELLQSGRKPNKTFSPPKQWGFSLAESFIEKQWTVMAPVFDNTWDHRELDRLCPLPLFTAKVVNYSARNMVYKAQIHSSHLAGSKDFPFVDIALKEFGHEKDFKREQSNLVSLRKLSNTHIAQSLATFSQGDRSYILSPWAGGGDLDHFWQTHGDGKRNSEMALWSLKQMLGLVKALYALHEELGEAVNCRHGDLKPGKILHFKFDDNKDHLGILKITGFGISRIHLEATFDRLERPTNTGATSPSYEAPEATATSKDAISLKYDIWSIGCIFLEFVIWLAQDWDAVQSFANARKSTSAHAGGAIPSHFYTIDKDDIVVHPEVFKIIKTLGRIPQSAPNTALGELLSIIKEGVIKIDPAERTDARGLCNQLEAIVSKARSDPVYLWDSRY
ncbi:protein kinase domain-containing protein [Colletotrichum scovillei]|uniref:protein kinase domain-containing protein n=1 Tax=Colletotrichum scovillei TaxID=1209932 RepID=UPI0015C2D2B0|nr:protein kinase domain-containing protein [Colletotrichum scovillei]KAF4784666.1 protein kinase domain-containing protein [Colletotrichum scovillei]